MIVVRKLFKTSLIIILTLVVVFTALPVLSVRAEAEVDDIFEYVNADTDYEAIIKDELGLISEDEKTKVVEEMKGFTDVGNLVLYITKQPGDSKAICQSVYSEYFEDENANGSVLLINEEEYNIYLYHAGYIAYGLEEGTSSKILSDNSDLIHDEGYAKFASVVFSELNSKVNKETVAAWTDRDISNVSDVSTETTDPSNSYKNTETNSVLSYRYF